MNSIKDEVNDIDYIYHSIRNRTNNLIINYLPEVWEKLTSINTLIKSDNVESRSNAVNSCRRILKRLADFVFPPTLEKKIVFGKQTSLEKKHYKNRIMAFLDSTSSSKTYKKIIGSNLKLYWKILDNIYKAGNKGAHEDILAKEEAETYIINTYLLVSEIINLWYLNVKPDDIMRGLDNTIFYLDNKKTVLNLYYPTKPSPYKLVISRAAQFGTRLRIYVKEDDIYIYDYDIQNVLPEDLEGFGDDGDLLENCYLQIGTYQFSENSLPMLLIAVGGSSIPTTLIILRYESKDDKKHYFGAENWKLIERFRGQSVAIFLNNQIFMPFGSVGFAHLIKFVDGTFIEEENEVLLKKELIFGEHPDM